MNIRNHPMRFTLLSACLALGGISAALAAPKVYVANETDGTVSVIATDTRQTVRTVTVGRVAMDMLMVDLEPVPGARPGSAVELWGDIVPIDAVARASGTIGYELMCALAQRVPLHVEDDAAS